MAVACQAGQAILLGVGFLEPAQKVGGIDDSVFELEGERITLTIKTQIDLADQIALFRGNILVRKVRVSPLLE